jgi:thioredoxin 1
MKIKTSISRMSIVATLLLVTAAVGCSTVDETVLGTIPPLSTARLDAVTDVTQGEAPVGEPAVSHADQSLTLVSSQSIARRPIRTLQSSEDLSELLESTSGVVLLDFYADWCGPCRRQSIVLHEVEEFASEVNAQIIKVNVDEHRELAKRYQVSSLPTLLAVKDGTVLEKNTGFTNRDRIKAMLR